MRELKQLEAKAVAPLVEHVTESSCWKLWTPQPAVARQNFWLNFSATLRWGMMSLESGASQLGVFQAALII